jgi:hypothetical protein
VCRRQGIKHKREEADGERRTMRWFLVSFDNCQLYSRWYVGGSTVYERSKMREGKEWRA